MQHGAIKGMQLNGFNWDAVMNLHKIKPNYLGGGVSNVIYK